MSRRELAEDANYWKTAEGEVMHLTAMESSHLFNTMKMLYNHLADAHELPEIGRSHRYVDFQTIAQREPVRIYRAIVALGLELQTRTDISPRKLDAARTMADSIRLGAETKKALWFALPGGKNG